MKIEKVNDNQIRCTLTSEDLADRELKLSELAYGTEKAKELFREMMQQASFEFGFEAEDIPLIIEAIPLNSGCIVLVITKVEDPEELDTRFSKFSPSVHNDSENNDFFDEGADDMAFSDSTSAPDDVMDLFQKIQDGKIKDSDKAKADLIAAAGEVKEAFKDIVEKVSEIHAKKEAKNSSQTKCRIFTFKSLNDITRAAKNANITEDCINTVYKDEKEGTYILVLYFTGANATEYNHICYALTEYGTVNKSISSHETYLEEHYSPLIKDNALQTLAQF